MEQEWVDTDNTKEREILDLRLINMQSALTLGRFRYLRAAAPLKAQCHDHWMVLLFVLSGKQFIIIDDREIVIRGGEMARVLPGQKYSSGSYPEQRGEVAWLILRCNPMPRGPALGMSAAGFKSIITSLADPKKPVVKPMALDARSCIESAFDWWDRRDDDIGREIIRNRISGLVLGSSAIYSGNDPDSLDRANELRILKVLQWMKENLIADQCSDKLAALSGLSKSSFHTHFKRVTGTTPNDYWLRLRIESAAKRLRQTPESTVTHIAHEFGFSSSQYFSIVFRRYLGLSPSAYRCKIED